MTPAQSVFSYVVTHDSGFAPNPFHGLCTIACCKPQIRRTARAGDLIVGLSTRCERVVYAMTVGVITDFEGYWENPRYAAKLPRMDSGRAVDRRGDNMYAPLNDGDFRQLSSRHSHRDGTEDPHHKRRDLSGVNVLISDRFVYWGDDGPPLPAELRFLEVGRGHRCNFSPEQVQRVVRWFESQPQGVQGAPAQWPSGDDTWQIV
jgi:hypothetical protein